MSKSIKSVVVLTVICLLTATMLAVVNEFTAPIIAAAEKEAELKALREVLPEGGSFTELEPIKDMPESVTKIYREDSGKGYVFNLSVSGYASGMKIVCGISSDGKMTGAVCLSSKETLGAEKTYGELFSGLSKSEAEKVDAVSGATLTSEAYKKAIKDAFDIFELLNESKEDK